MALPSDDGGGASSPASSPTNYGRAKVSMANIYDDPTSAADGVGRVGGAFRSPAAKALLAAASVALLIASAVSLGANHANNIKELSDTVTTLTLQLNRQREEAERRLSELRELERKVGDKDIELAWETQHVRDVEELKEEMERDLTKKIKKGGEDYLELAKLSSEFAQKTSVAEEKVESEHKENANLKVALAFALEELSKAREQLPPAPDSEGLLPGKDVEKQMEKRKLRGKNVYQPGDNIEIICDEGGGKVALRPGEFSLSCWRETVFFGAGGGCSEIRGGGLDAGSRFVGGFIPNLFPFLPLQALSRTSSQTVSTTS